jgi:predicted metal-dependent enzyme (double-stranded beta helix superfamily)
VATFARTAGGHDEQVAADPALRWWFQRHAPAGQLRRNQLEQLTRALGNEPELWRHLVRHSTAERFYVRLHLDDDLEVWLICWSQRQDTGFHDHDGARGAVTVVQGALAERRLALTGSAPTSIHPTGSTFSFGANHIHDVSQTGAAVATSLHAYSPPLGEMGFYEFAADGTLTRRRGDYREEFC